MYIFNLKYYKKGDSICGDDFKRDPQFDKINLEFISSLSELKTFELPSLGKEVSKYALLTMNNGDKYYIHEDFYNRLINELDGYC